jgi:predicted metal-dependent hydrolase
MGRERAESLSLWDRLAPRSEFTIRRSPKARRVRLQVTDDGEALIVMPLRAAEHEASDLYDRHRDWVARQQAKVEERRIKLATRPSLAAGRLLKINGTPRVVRVANAAQRDLLERRLREEAREIIAARVAVRAPQMEVQPRALQIRDQKSRWGSASRHGGLSFSWRLILAPVDVLDYVVVHELAHLRHGGHGKRFWDLVEKHYGDHRAARKWLRDHNDEIRQALD